VRLSRTSKKGISQTIACISDTHLLVPDTRSAALFPKRLKSLTLQEQHAMYAQVSQEIERAYLACVEQIKQSKPDIIIHLGDITSGWEKGGMGDPSVRALVQRCADDLKALHKPLYCILGNHDIGKVGKEPANIAEATDIYEQVFGPLFWQFETQGLLSLGMCSPLAYYHGKDPSILKRKKDQETFLVDTLAAYPEKKWVLYVHDPMALRHVIKQIGPHLRRCRKVIVGHFHRPSTGRLIRYASRVPVTKAMLSSRMYRRALSKVVVAPSTAPLWYKGYGWLQLEVRGNTMKAHRMRALRPIESQDLPTRSLRWCFGGIEK
jgi:predicted phosphodiesterase